MEELNQQQVVDYIKGISVLELSQLVKTLESMKSEAFLTSVESQEIEACGAGPIALCLELAALLGKTNIKTLVTRNSGEVSGDMTRVVGYLSAVIW